MNSSVGLSSPQDYRSSSWASTQTSPSKTPIAATSFPSLETLVILVKNVWERSEVFWGHRIYTRESLRESKREAKGESQRELKRGRCACGCHISNLTKFDDRRLHFPVPFAILIAQKVQESDFTSLPRARILGHLFSIEYAPRIIWPHQDWHNRKH